MTKGALKQRYIPLSEDWHNSNLFRSLLEDHGPAGPLIWIVLNLEWREPEADILTQDINGAPVRGLHRRCRFSHIWAKLPGIGSKKLASVIIWLHEQNHWQLSPVCVANMSELCARSAHSLHRRDTQSRHIVEAWWPKLLQFRERVLQYAPIGKERKGKDIRNGSDEPPNQNQAQPDPQFRYQFDEKSQAMVKVPIRITKPGTDSPRKCPESEHK